LTKFVGTFEERLACCKEATKLDPNDVGVFSDLDESVTRKSWKS